MGDQPRGRNTMISTMARLNAHAVGAEVAEPFRQADQHRGQHDTDLAAHAAQHDDGEMIADLMKEKLSG